MGGDRDEEESARGPPVKSIEKRQTNGAVRVVGAVIGHLVHSEMIRHRNREKATLDLKEQVKLENDQALVPKKDGGAESAIQEEQKRSRRIVKCPPRQT